MYKYVFLTLLASLFAATAFATEYSCIQQDSYGEIHSHELVISTGEGPEILLDGFPVLENTTGFKKGCKGMYWMQAPAGYKRYTAILQSPSDTAFSCTMEEDVLIEQTLIDGDIQGAIRFIEDEGVGDAIPCTLLN